MDPLQPNIPHTIPEQVVPVVTPGYSRAHWILVIISFVIFLALAMMCVHFYFNPQNKQVSEAKLITADKGYLVEGFPQTLLLFPDAEVVSSTKEFQENGMVVYASAFLATTTIQEIDAAYGNMFANAGFTKIGSNIKVDTSEGTFQKDTVIARVFSVQRGAVAVFTVNYTIPAVIDVKK